MMAVLSSARRHALPAELRSNPRAAAWRLLACTDGVLQRHARQDESRSRKCNIHRPPKSPSCSPAQMVSLAVMPDRMKHSRSRNERSQGLVTALSTSAVGKEGEGGRRDEQAVH